LILLDTSVLIASLFPRQEFHDECVDAITESEPPFYLSPFVLAETDYFILKWAGVDFEAKFLAEVARGAYELMPFDAEDLAEARHLILKYRSLKIGLADASIAVLAAKYDCYDLLTLDERHFRAIKPAPRKSFRILPADL
jgi:predicted nucleic acid-binding protein